MMNVGIKIIPKRVIDTQNKPEVWERCELILWFFQLFEVWEHNVAWKTRYSDFDCAGIRS